MINSKLKSELKLRRYTIKEFAEKVNISYTYANEIINGKKPINQIDLLRKISDFLGVPITYWFDDETKSVSIGSHNVVNGNNNKIEVQLNAEIERLKTEIEMLKVELRLKNELIESLRAHIKSLMRLDK